MTSGRKAHGQFSDTELGESTSLAVLFVGSNPVFALLVVSPCLSRMKDSFKTISHWVFTAIPAISWVVSTIGMQSPTTQHRIENYHYDCQTSMQ